MLCEKRPASSSTQQPVFPKRAVPLLLVTVGTMFNYLHRMLLAVAAPSIAAEYDIDSTALGVMFAAFSWTYAMTQIPGGVVLDRIGSKLTYFLAVATWSLFTALHSIAIGLKTLIFFRLSLGVAQAPCFPTNARIIRSWFPQQERARATAIFTVGEFIVLACFSPYLYWILMEMGWRMLFLMVGCAGILFSLVWYRLYREPCSDTEQDKTEAETMPTSLDPDPQRFSWGKTWSLLKRRQILGLCIGGFAANTTLIFFLTWFPTYLIRECQMPWLESGFFAVFPFLAASVGVITGGWLSDHLLRRTKSATIARKVPVLAGLLLATNILWANVTDNNLLIIGILSIAFFGQGMTGLSWALIADIAPQKQMGLTGGICNFSTNVAGIVTPVVIGFIISQTGSFHYALAFISLMALLGVCSYLFLIGEVKQIVLEE